MKARRRIFTIGLLTLAATIGTSLVSKRSPNLLEPGSADPWSIRQGEKLQSWIETKYESQHLYSRTPIPLAFSRAFSERFTRASGKVQINFETGSIQVSVNGLDPNPVGSAYQLWFVEDVPGPNNTAAIDLGSNGDHIMNLGKVPESGSWVTRVDPRQLEDFEINMAAVMRVSPGRKPEFVIGGMQSIRYLIGREAKLEKARKNHISFESLLGVTPAFAQGGNPKKPVSLVAQGKDLFTNGTFGGNGRTCATCHRLEFETTIDPTFISTLLPGDPLFAGEGKPLALPEFSDVDPLLPAFESPFRMRTQGLILENIDGTERDSTTGKLLHAPVFRMTPAIFNLSFTEPYGDSACCADLQIFSAGAVFQHFTKTLNRVAGVDFQTPTTAQLQALEAFQLSLSSPVNGNFKISGRGSLLSTKADALATDTNRPEVRGRNFFLAANSCGACHQGTVLDGTNPVTGATLNLDTGVETFGRLRTPTVDDGDNTGKFQIPQLFGLRKTHFFHNGAAGNNTLPLPGRSLLFTNLRSAVEFYKSDAFKSSPTGLEINGTRFQALFAMTDVQMDDVAAFLEAISKP